MGRINAEGLALIKTEKETRLTQLTQLISKPFHLEDKQQIQALKQQMNDFEFHLNQMYLYQSMHESLKLWFGSWIIGIFLPIPAFFNYLLTSCFYFGLSGKILEHFSINEFENHLQEMKTLYNWCLKDNQPHYHSQIDNTEKLAHKEIQRLIHLLAPVCSVDFMLAWKKEIISTTTPPNHTLMSFFSTVSVPIQSALSYFSNAKIDLNLQRINELKRAVESRDFDIGVYAGAEKAIKFFTTSPYLREWLSQQLTQPVEYIKNALPGIISLSKKN